MMMKRKERRWWWWGHDDKLLSFVNQVKMCCCYDCCILHQVTYIPKFFSFLIRCVHLLYRMISSHRNTIHSFICSFKNNIYDEKSARAHHSISSWVATICPSEKMCVKANSYNKNAGFESGKKGDKIYFHIKHQTSSNTKKQNSTIILCFCSQYLDRKMEKGKKLIDR